MAYDIRITPETSLPEHPTAVERLYIERGLVPPWFVNWRDGRPVPLGSGGVLDRYPRGVMTAAHSTSSFGAPPSR